jgi:hypothetical protein
MSEHELLEDCLRRLNACGIAYMITGSMASNFWGLPRTTHDLDFVIQISPQKVPTLANAFDGDFFVQESSIHAAFRPPYQFNFIDNRSNLKLDFWMTCDDAFDRSRFARRKQMTVANQPAWIATAEDTILHKLIWNEMSPSDRQLTDIAGIISVQGKALDQEYLQSWATLLGVAATWEDLRSGKILPKTT